MKLSHTGDPAAAKANKLDRELWDFHKKFVKKFDRWLKTTPSEEGLDMMQNAMHLVAGGKNRHDRSGPRHGVAQCVQKATS